MIRAVILLLCAAGAPALACTPPRHGVEIVPAHRIPAIAAAELRASDAVLDAVVTGRTPEGLVLRPIRVWKGPRQPRYIVYDHPCGPRLPGPGSRVRVMLSRAEQPGQPWNARYPALGGRTEGNRLLDREIDRLLGSPRP